MELKICKLYIYIYQLCSHCFQVFSYQGLNQCSLRPRIMDGGLGCTDLPVTGSFLKGGWAPTLNLSKDSSKFFVLDHMYLLRCHLE